MHLLGASKFFYRPERYEFFTGVFESFDGGLTWTQEQPEGVESYTLTSDPVTTFDDAGNGYFTLLTRGPTGLDMLKKPRQGSWGRPVAVDRTTNTDKQWIAGDQNPRGQSPFAGNVYMSWTDFGSRNVIVQEGVVHFWGLVGSESERNALTALAREVPGVTEVADEMIPAY